MHSARRNFAFVALKCVAWHDFIAQIPWFAKSTQPFWG